MAKQYLLEIGTEEIPARFMPRFLAELKEKTEQQLSENRLTFKSVTCKGTYRRLAIIVSGLPASQEDLSETVTGPPKAIAFDADGHPLPPAIGFAKRLGVDPKTLDVVSQNGKDVVAAQRFEKGQKTQNVLPGLIQEVVNALTLPIAMKWGSGEATFFRPVHWIVSLLDDKVLPVSFYGAKAGRESLGHRFLTQHPKKAHMASGIPVKITSVNTYESDLKKAKVLLDQDRRKKDIEKALCPYVKAEDIDPDLLEEVTFLVEWPTVLEGRFDEGYLQIPDPVLIQCMKKHQKYFPIIKDQKLTAGFLVVGDSVTARNKTTIIAGNENVLLARLEDVRFFWEEDLKQPLEELLPKLEAVVYQKGLGSLADKVGRLQGLAAAIVQNAGLDNSADDIRRTIQLAKADLVSLMVYELPDLQGVMGALYAQKQKEKKAVYTGIEEHYYPRFSGDRIPSTTTGLVASLADKLDTVVACFVNDMIPTGSQDPLGVRRAIYGIIRLCLEGKKGIQLDLLVAAAFEQFKSQKNAEKLKDFFTQRAATYFQDQGAAYDTVAAVLAVYPYDVLTAQRQIQAIEKDRTKNNARFKEMVETAVRVQRLAVKHPTAAAPIQRHCVEAIEGQVIDLLAQLHQNGADIASLHTLTGPLSDFFDQVLVMDKDAAIKANRLAILSQAHALYQQVADFDAIVVK